MPLPPRVRPRVAVPIALSALVLAAAPAVLLAQHGGAREGLRDLTTHPLGIAALLVFVIAYLLVMQEERLHLRKSKPVVLAAGVIWTLVALAYAGSPDQEVVAGAVRGNILEFGELFLFLLAAMTYVNTMEERQVFDALRAWLLRRGLSYRGLFWVTGLIAFFLSPVLDNMTTALVVGAVAIAVGQGNPRFITVACINVVVAANAGGAFSPFGDITTLMVWQAGKLPFFDFFALFLPCVVNWGVPALLMSLSIPRERPAGLDTGARLRPGAMGVVGLFALTILVTVLMHNFLHLPPVLGMMTGMGLLKVYSWHLTRRAAANGARHDDASGPLTAIDPDEATHDSFDIFAVLARAEWDTLMFFYGIILCVGGLGTIGYLAGVSEALYTDLGALPANVAIGLISSVIDNIPVMFAVISMDPAMSEAEWLLVTMTAGVGGSLLSIGSAAGVALMGQARGVYTFRSHLRWTWAVGLGYVLSIVVHVLVNGR